MIGEESLIGILVVVVLSGIWLELKHRRKREFQRLFRIRQLEAEMREHGYEEQDAAKEHIVILDSLSDKLGKAGFYSGKERREAQLLRASIIVGGSILGGVVGFSFFSHLGFLFGTLVGLYFGFTAWVVVLQRKIKEQERRVFFFTPLCLETLILLVESGLSILPALGNLVNKEERGSYKNPAKQILKVVYDLSSNGISFGRALEMVSERVDYRVLKHVLLHLDISGNEGGELVPALRSLSDHAGAQWKMSAETRVRLLENYSIFPVFGAIMGLLILTAAVPTVTAFKAIQPAGQVETVTNNGH